MISHHIILRLLILCYYNVIRTTIKQLKFMKAGDLDVIPTDAVKYGGK